MAISYTNPFTSSAVPAITWLSAAAGSALSLGGAVTDGLAAATTSTYSYGSAMYAPGTYRKVTEVAEPKPVNSGKVLKSIIGLQRRIDMLKKGQHD